MENIVIFITILTIIVITYLLYVKSIPSVKYQLDTTGRQNRYKKFEKQCGNKIPKELAIFDPVYISYDGKFTLLTAHDLHELNKRLGGWNSVDVEFIDAINELIKRDLWSLEIVNGLECMIKDGMRPALDYAFLFKNSHKEYIKYFGDKIASFPNMSLEEYKNKYFIKEKCY
jgi:hypothetical protein